MLQSTRRGAVADTQPIDYDSYFGTMGDIWLTRIWRAGSRSGALAS